MHVKSLSIIALALGLSACGGSPSQPPVSVAAPPPPMIASPAASNLGAVLGPDGRCTGSATASASTIEPGIGECELVRLKGKAPTDVLIGEGGGTREVQVLYAEPGGRELYLFVDNRLNRIVR